MVKRRINLSKLIIVIKKEMIEFKNDSNAFIPLIILPVLFGIVLPLISIYVLKNINFIELVNRVSSLNENLTNIIGDSYKINEPISWLRVLLTTLFSPIFVLISVLSAIVLASTSFAGEREGKTLESLLYTPLSNEEIVGGKSIASFFPSVLLSWITILLYLVISNFYLYSLYGQVILPDKNFILLTILLIPLILIFAIELVIFVSQRAKTVKSAGSMVSLLLLPIMSVLIGQIAGIFIFGTVAILTVSLVLLIFDFIGFLIISKFNREKLLLG